MKKVLKLTSIALMFGASLNVLASSGYQIKAGSWYSAYGTNHNCTKVNSSCVMIKLPHPCNPNKIFVNSKNKNIQNSVNNRSNVEVIVRGGKRICKIS